MKRWFAVVAVVAVVFGVVGVEAAEPLAWPRFRGPNGSGIAEGQSPPVEFGPDKNVKWKVAVPSGWSSPVIAGDTIVITAFDQEKLYTIAYHRASGDEVWRKEAPAKQIEKYLEGEGSPAASTPATDGERIVSYFGSCGLACYDLTGNELWKYEMPTIDLPGNFGSGVSPILVDGTVILVRDQARNAQIVALDAATGTLKWETNRESPVSYCTPIVSDSAEGKVVLAAGHMRLIAYDLASGVEHWSVTGLPSGCCTSPVTADGVLYFAGWSPGGSDEPEFQMPAFDGLLTQFDTNKDGTLSRDEVGKTFGGFFDSQDQNKDDQISREEYDAVVKFMTEGKNNAFAVTTGGKGDVTASQMLWTQTKGLPYIATAILYRGQLVMVKDGGIVTSYDAKSGEQVYMKRSAAGGKYYASPVAANGLVYFTSLDDGTVTVMKGGRTEPEVVAKNPPLGERVAATPAIADDTLYIRTAGHLYAFASPE